MDTVSTTFIDALIQQQIPVDVFLIGGIKLSGFISHQDKFAITMSGRSTQLIYKRAISTICPESNRPSPSKTHTTS